MNERSRIGPTPKGWIIVLPSAPPFDFPLLLQASSAAAGAQDCRGVPPTALAINPMGILSSWWILLPYSQQTAENVVNEPPPRAVGGAGCHLSSMLGSWRCDSEHETYIVIRTLGSWQCDSEAYGDRDAG